jgi:putative NADH-flavin reductase
MKIAVFGATGQLGQECARQALAAGHEVRVLARTPSKLAEDLRDRVELIEGDALIAADVEKTLVGIDAVMFAIGVDKKSPEKLCTEATRLILNAVPRLGVDRFVWCGGGSTQIGGDPDNFSAKFVRVFAARFMGKRHRDKHHQFALLRTRSDVSWYGVRPLQMRQGDHTGNYRVGMDKFSGTSKISFADCADAMVDMLTDDTWRHQAPIVQY